MKKSGELWGMSGNNGSRMGEDWERGKRFTDGSEWRKGQRAFFAYWDERLLLVGVELKARERQERVKKST